VAWVGYANAAIRDQLGPLLPAVLREHGLWPEDGERGGAD
jgi:hypothetical protein